MSKKKIDFIVTLYAYYQGDLHTVKAKETAKSYIIDWDQEYSFGQRLAFDSRERYSKEYDRVFLSAKDAYDFFLKRLEEEENTLLVKLHQAQCALETMRLNKPEKE